MPGKGEQGLMDPRQDEAKYKQKKGKKASHRGGEGDEVRQSQDGGFSSRRS